MTEAEAKTKWCPFVRYSDIDGPASNRWKQHATEQDPEPHALNPAPCRCIGSACMAWRWTAATALRKQALPGSFSTSDDGFCGLAGRP